MTKMWLDAVACGSCEAVFGDEGDCMRLNQQWEGLEPGVYTFPLLITDQIARRLTAQTTARLCHDCLRTSDVRLALRPFTQEDDANDS